MSNLIVVCGFGGSGKTTLAKAISAKTNIVCFHKDSIKAALSDRLNFETNNTYDFFIALAEEQIKNNVDILIEAPFSYKNDIELFESWIRKYNINLYCVVCSIDSKTRRQRVESRERHKCHEEADMKLKKELESESFDFQKFPGAIINITTDKSVDELVEQVMESLNL